MIITTEEAIQRLQPWREQWKRIAWKPITQDGETAITDSKFAGTPYPEPTLTPPLDFGNGPPADDAPSEAGN